MGQGESHLKGSFIFAQLTNPYKQYIDSISDPSQYDNLLTHPELYGFRMCPLTPQEQPKTLSLTSEVSHLITANERPRLDSRLNTRYHRNNSLLVEDLCYIDRVYYSESANKHVLRKNIQYDESGEQISFKDIITASPDKTIKDIHLSYRYILKLSPNISMLSTIRTLDLSGNYLLELPESIGYMQQIEVLLLAKNRLISIPNTIGYLSNLIELDLANNNLCDITPCICYLEKLKILSLAYNSIKELPVNISGLTNLISLDLSGNPIQILPAEVSQLPYLRRIRLEQCLLNNTAMVYSLEHNPPSLMEICARSIVLNKTPHSDIPEHIIKYIQSASKCSSCRRPYFESYVMRGRIIEKTDIKIPIEYRLCSAHWSDVDDRMLSMFSTHSQPISAHIVPLPVRPILPSPKTPLTADRISILNIKSHHPSAIASETNDSIITTDGHIAEESSTPTKTTKRIKLNRSIFTKWTSKFQRSIS